jgi:hypothetical protein
MAAPNVAIAQTNGNLGLLAQSDDSISAIIVSGVAGSFALGDVLGPFTSLEEVEAIGITAAYDTTNTCLAHKHISDFYSQANKGTKLFVMVLAKTVTLSQMCNTSSVYIKAIINAQPSGKPMIIMVTRVPDGGYTPTYTNQLDTDITNAITLSKALIEELQEEQVYTRFLIEGRDWQGTVASTVNLRDTATSPLANRTCIVFGNDNDFVTALSGGDLRKKYAAVGYVGGKLASVPIRRNIGRTADGPSGIVAAGFSNGAAYKTLTTAQINTLHDKGFIFLRNFPGQAGYYWNYDHTATKETDDYNNLRYGRVIDRACIICYNTLVLNLNDEITIDADKGTIPASVVKNIEGQVEVNIKGIMSEDIVAVDATIDPDVNILVSGNIEVELEITPKGNATSFTVKVGLRNPYTA